MWRFAGALLALGCISQQPQRATSSAHLHRAEAAPAAQRLGVSRCEAVSPLAAGEPDTRLHVACLQAQLAREVASMGAGVAAGHRPSGFVLVVAARRVLYSTGLGYADHDRLLPNTADTSFRIGSVTKPFTAAAVIKLAIDGRISFEDTVQKYLPEFPDTAGRVTIHQLLTHTAGLMNYTDLPWFETARSRPVSTRDLLELFWNERRLLSPGVAYAYSNSNYVVLGAIIERVTGLSYARYMQEEVFAPNGLCRTEVGDAREMANRALGYRSNHEQLAPAQAIDMSVAFSAGGIRSTANDLVRWHQALMGSAFIPEEQKWRLYQWTPDGYAYGWKVEERRGFRVVSHSGSIDGFSASYARIPDLDLVVVVLSNNESVRLRGLSKVAISGALGDPDVCDLEAREP